MSAPGATVRCPLCGATFPAVATCTGSCPLAGTCRTLCCPYCSYRFVATGTVSGWLERLLRGART